MAAFSAKDDTMGLDVDPGKPYFQNLTTVDGLVYYRNTIGHHRKDNADPGPAPGRIWTATAGSAWPRASTSCIRLRDEVDTTEAGSRPAPYTPISPSGESSTSFGKKPGREWEAMTSRLGPPGSNKTTALNRRGGVNGRRCALCRALSEFFTVFELDNYLYLLKIPCITLW